ncbi:glycoside hydrolase [Aspergillus uvarum CBS 121591]|uniref:chitinase n=1 Tax=Aspergillus uvarum CBS 121591 TaxID=1448315 RepID=A0A319CLM5_9EURO|nr:glycoside hydrolase [Aspergillus uvarum CBS 121591]PYH86435.1 glycoside hydrolase [Aspergillus uvarum CBS 121591]
MDISKFQGSDCYMHVHWAFANVTTDWAVDVSGYQGQFDGLLNLTGISRILSFGGWGFSTTSYTYSIFRTGVQTANQQTFAQNVVDFIVDNNLDGVEFDWEYPGAQDIPGVPADSVESPQNYLEFLKIDYIVYMTYDLHGQWDYNRTYADPGCPNGGCLRSQVNKTETEYALSMITKAGVPAKQVVAGLAMYGRSFKMAEANCTEPECLFTGPDSGADAGECTQTPGYLANYEIYEILVQAENPDLYGNISITQYHDEGDVLIYNETNWMSWLSLSSYAARQSWTDGLNFGGTSHWAVDLNETYSNNGTGNELSSGLELDFTVCEYSLTFASLRPGRLAAHRLRRRLYSAGADRHAGHGLHQLHQREQRLRRDVHLPKQSSFDTE